MERERGREGEGGGGGVGGKGGKGGLGSISIHFDSGISRDGGLGWVGLRADTIRYDSTLDGWMDR